LAGARCLLPAMFTRGVLVAWSLGVLPLGAQEAPVLPEPGETALPDTITPVPLPKDPFGATDLLQPTIPETLTIDNQGSQEATLEGGVKFGGPVKITGDNGLEVFADTATLDVKQQVVILDGKVSVYQGNVLQRGAHAVYYYERKFLDTRDLSVSLDPIILEAGKFTVEEHGGKQVFVGENAGLTTHDVEHPNFWLRAAQTKVYPGDKITFKNLRVYAGDVPVFWLPYLSQPLDPELGYHFMPGARSGWGAFLLNSYGVMLGGKLNPETGENEDAWLLSRWHLDLRSSRGVGTGVDLADTRLDNRANLPGLSLYYLNDLDPEYSRSGVPRTDVDPNRYRVELKHRQPLDFPDRANWYLDANLTLLSDAYYLEDLLPEVYRSNPAPDSTIGLFRRDETSLLSLFARPQLNDFFQTATRLPELAFDQARGPWFGLPLLHEGSTSFGLLEVAMDEALRREISDPQWALSPVNPGGIDPYAYLQGYERQLAERIRGLPPGSPELAGLKDQLLNTGFARFHTYHDFSLPLAMGSGLSLTPQVGLGYTRYMAVDGPATTTDRFHLRAGVEAAAKFSKNLGDLKNHSWGLDGLLHVVQPYVSWSVLASDDLDPLYPQVDRLTFSTRPRTLSPERFTATDDLESWDIVRLGARNRLLTKRDGQAHEWLYLDTYLDAFLENPETDRTFSNLYNDFRFQPLPWLTLGMETQFPILDGGSGFTEFSTYCRVMPTPDMELTLGYRWLDNHPVLPDSNRVDLRAFFRLSENWGIGSQHVLRFDDGTLELQQYTLHRDFGNWVAGVGLSSRDNLLKNEYGVLFSLTLKDLPSVSLPFSIDME
jgi:LPS-assembly protein